MKHIRPYTNINESMGRGSVLFVKGKPEGGKRKLFVTQILGHAEVKPGVTMFFLANDFYRLKEEDGRLKIQKVDLSDSALRPVLNIKSEGKISVVKNNAKTPWHWKSLKHTSIAAAVRELEDEIRFGDYILESSDVNSKVKFATLYNHVVKKVLSVAILGNRDPELIITDFSVSKELQRKISEVGEDSTVDSDWEANFDCIYLGKEHRDLLEEFEIGPMFDISLALSSEASVDVTHYPGDRETPDDWDVEVISVQTELQEVYLEGGSAEADPELQRILKEANRKLSDMDETDLEHELKKNIVVPEHLKKGE